MGVCPPSAPPPNMGSGGRKPFDPASALAQELRELEPHNRRFQGVLYVREARINEGYSALTYTELKPPAKSHSCSGCGAPRLGACDYCGAP